MTSHGAAGRIDDGLLLFSTGNYYGAEAAFRDAIGLDETCAAAYLHLGWTLLNLDKNLEAGAAFQRAIRLNPDAASAHEGLGLVLANEQRYPAAKAEFRAAVSLDPASPDLWRELAELERDPGGSAPSPETLLRSPRGSPRARPLRRFYAGVIDICLIPGCCCLFVVGFRWWGIAMGTAIYALNGYVEGMTGQSYGKMLTGLHTVNGTTGKYLGGGKGVLRRFLLIADYGTAVSFVIGLFAGQTIADAIMDTVIVWRPSRAKAPANRGQSASCEWR